MFRNLINTETITEIVQKVGGIGYLDITMLDLESETGANRLSQEYYNITNGIITGKVRFLTETQFKQDSTGNIYSMI